AGRGGVAYGPGNGARWTGPVSAPAGMGRGEPIGRHQAMMALAGAAAVCCAAPLAVSAAPAARAAARAGTWGTAIKVPGLKALNQGGLAELNSVSCGSAGSCAAGGTYTDASGHTQAFVVNQS